MWSIFLQVDHAGRFYEDFYRVVVQNERYDDWTKSIKLLRRIFLEYDDYVLHFHEPDWSPVYSWKPDGIKARWDPYAALGETKVNWNVKFSS